METLIIDEMGNVKNSTFEIPFNTFMENIEDITSSNSIMSVSKDNYLVQYDNKSYYLTINSTTPEEMKKRIKEACKTTKMVEKAKDTLSLSKIDENSITRNIAYNKEKRSEANRDLALYTFKSLLRILEIAIAIGGIPGTIALAVLTSGIWQEISAVGILIAIGVDTLVGIGLMIGEIDWYDISDPFCNFIDSCDDKFTNIRERRLLNKMRKLLPNKQLESSNNVKQLNSPDSTNQISVDEKIESIIEKAEAGLDPEDCKTILEELRPIVEKYARSISMVKPGFKHKKDVNAISKVALDAMSSIESKISLLIRRKNLEKAIGGDNNLEEIVIEKEEEGPTRRLTPQN